MYDAARLFGDFGLELERLAWKPDDLFGLRHGLVWFIKGNYAAAIGATMVQLGNGRIWRAARNIVTNEPQAIHRTALMPDGAAVKRNGKTFRMSLGPTSGGAIKLDPDEDVTRGLCLGEGVETCLSGRQMGLRPVWSAVNTGGVKNFAIVPGIEGLHIFAENDAEGQSAEVVEACARRWYEAGRAVIIVEPDTAKDLNDELREAAR
jgi:putative DNA primase/helicase